MSHVSHHTSAERSEKQSHVWQVQDDPYRPRHGIDESDRIPSRLPSIFLGLEDLSVES